ncbi:hypothetical protein [Fulvivirga lutea]|uniref:Uncharacterized protein n=1 Tax=Fulvivirga lutea TaxID=2810512 RepID=A0A974WIL6_9BACT|nr:hypothetical protein [Fulvivirga lutea]QSE98438.1 hypothetical protein JR347_05005 [Fulvivirga lutea]
MAKIILFELNEVPFKVIDYFVRKYPNSTLAQILPISKQFETVTDDQGHLHPWSTWPTLHRGVDNSVHKIKDFGEDLSELNKKYPPVWQILQENSIKTGVCGSLHSYPLPTNAKEYDFYIPDPFAWGSETHPKEIQPFQEFNLAMVKGSARNVNSGFDKKAALKLGTNLSTIGVRAKTVSAIAKQLVDEKLSSWKVVRRRSFQSIMAFDVFLKQLKKHKPQFSTFFSNHVAATMHRYWAATFPEDYEEYLLSDEWKNRYSKEIDYAMHKFDGFLSDVVDFVKSNPEYKLIIASSMGQESTLAMEQKSELLAKNFDLFLNKLGFTNEDYSILPAMHPQYNASFKNDSKRSELIEILKQFDIKGDKIESRIKENGFISIDLGHRNLEENDVKFKEEIINLKDYGLVNEPIQDEASGTAYHIPQGILIVFDPTNRDKAERVAGVNSKRIAPSILANFGVKPADYMQTNLIDAIAKS